MKSEEEDAVVTGADALRCGHGLVLQDVSRAHNASHLVIATKLRGNQTSYNVVVVEVGPAIAIALAAMPELSFKCSCDSCRSCRYPPLKVSPPLSGVCKHFVPSSLLFFSFVFFLFCFLNSNSGVA